MEKKDQTRVKSSKTSDENTVELEGATITQEQISDVYKEGTIDQERNRSSKR